MQNIESMNSPEYKQGFQDATKHFARHLLNYELNTFKDMTDFINFLYRTADYSPGTNVTKPKIEQ